MSPKAWSIAVLCLAGCAQQPLAPPPGRTSAEILEKSAPADWRPLDPENTLYLELASGRVVMELAPAFAPLHADNIRALAREQYFDGLAIVRSQENYVVQWGDPEEDEKKARPIKGAKAALPPEFVRDAAGLAFTELDNADAYAREVGHSAGFPAARDGDKAWLAHCYGMLGVSRGNTADSGSGAALYVVIGHSPRHLDRNITLAGRVVKGMELLTTLPRGKEALGFYAKDQKLVPIKALRVAADVPAAQRTELELLRTDTATWTEYVDSRRWRREEWFLDKVGRVELCNVPLPVRTPAP